MLDIMEIIRNLPCYLVDAIDMDVDSVNVIMEITLDRDILLFSG